MESRVGIQKHDTNVTVSEKRYIGRYVTVWIPGLAVWGFWLGLLLILEMYDYMG